MVILLEILKGLWVLWERLDYEMGEEVWDLFGQCWNIKLSVVPVLLTLGISKPVGSQLSTWTDCLYSIGIVNDGNI